MGQVFHVTPKPLWLQRLPPLEGLETTTKDSVIVTGTEEKSNIIELVKIL
jgi:hypothetical protein